MLRQKYLDLINISRVYMLARLNPSDRSSLHLRVTFSSVAAISHGPAISSPYA